MMRSTHPALPRVIGRGSASPLDPGGVARRPGLVRHADPTAWTVAAAVAEATAGLAGLPAALLEEVGMICVSAEGPRQAILEVAAGSRQGLASPLRFAAANPGSLVGLACTAMGFRGPTLNLTLPPERGVPLAADLAARWLDRQQAAAVVLAACTAADGQPRARCLVLAGPDFPAADLPMSPDEAGRWLCSPPEGLPGEVLR